MYEIYFHSFITGLLSMLIGAGVGTASYYGVLHSLLPSFLLGWVIGGACHLVLSRYEDGFTFCGYSHFDNYSQSVYDLIESFFGYGSGAGAKIVGICMLPICLILLISSCLVFVFIAMLNIIAFPAMTFFDAIMAVYCYFAEPEEEECEKDNLVACSLFVVLILSALLSFVVISNNPTVSEALLDGSTIVDHLVAAEKDDNTIDPFEEDYFGVSEGAGFVMNFSGIAPRAELTVKNNFPATDARSSLTYSVSKIHSIKRGDMIIVTVTPPSKGFDHTLKSTGTVVYTDHLRSYLTDASLLTNDTILDFQNICMERIRKCMDVGLVPKSEKGSKLSDPSGIGLRKLYVLKRKGDFSSDIILIVSFGFQALSETGERGSYIGYLWYQDKDNPPIINEDDLIEFDPEKMAVATTCYTSDVMLEKKAIDIYRDARDITECGIGIIVE